MTNSERAKLILTDLNVAKEQREQLKKQLRETKRNIERLTGALLLLQQIEQEENQGAG